MDNAELSRLTSTLLAAVAEAESLVRTGRKDAKLRELVRHAREMHELLLEALLEHPTLSTSDPRRRRDQRQRNRPARSAYDPAWHEALTSAQCPKNPGLQTNAPALAWPRHAPPGTPGAVDSDVSSDRKYGQSYRRDDPDGKPRDVQLVRTTKHWLLSSGLTRLRLAGNV